MPGSISAATRSGSRPETNASEQSVWLTSPVATRRALSGRRQKLSVVAAAAARTSAIRSRRRELVA
jgi:hypothetical protein